MLTLNNMQPQQFTKPFYIFFLVIPAGISIGFVTVTLPYLLTKNGFTVAEASTIVAIGASAHLWRFLWGPIADLTLSLRKWFWIGTSLSSIALLILCFTPFTKNGAVLLTSVVFISQVAATFILLPVGGFMAHRIENLQKGRAAGWYQAGNLGGVGLGGGAGLWLATHYSIPIAGIALVAGSLLFSFVIQLIADVQSNKDNTIVQEVKTMGASIVSMIKIPIALFVIIMITMPIGTGALANIWSAVATDWKTDGDTVALVTGITSGLVSAIGCIAGGVIADRWGVWVAYLGSGIVCALVNIVMALFPYQPIVYIIGVLAYAFGTGLIYAAFSAVILFAIGKKAAATKYSMLSSLGNVPVVFMTVVNGWVHDKYNSKYMLLVEAAIGILFIIICAIVLQRMFAKKQILASID